MLIEHNRLKANHTRRQSDSELIAACRQGEASAWEALVLRYQRLIYTIPMRAGLDEEEADEVFQRVFAKLVESLPRIEQPDRIQAWLVTTAKRETRRLQRQQARSQPLWAEGDDEGAMLVTDEPSLPQEVIQRLEEQHLVRVALEMLEERCRTLLTLLFYNNHPPAYAEIAISLGLPAGSIGPQRARCLEKLARLLRKAGF